MNAKQKRLRAHRSALSRRFGSSASRSGWAGLHSGLTSGPKQISNKTQMNTSHSSAASEEIESMSSAESVESVESSSEDNADNLELHRSALCRLSTKMTADECTAMSKVWADEGQALLLRDVKAQGKANGEKADVLTAIAFRLAGEARDMLKDMDRESREHADMLAAAEWLLSGIENGFEADEMDEFLNLVIQGR